MKRVGIVGFGEMGKRHGKDLEEFSGGEIEIAGVFEPSDESYAAGCEWMSKPPRRCPSMAAMLDELNLDGIVISTPNSLHLECLRELEGRAIPVLLEKPLDTSLEKVRDIMAFADAYPAPIMVHHVMRYSPIVRKAKELIDEGRIGRIAGFDFVQFIGGHMFHNFRRTFKTGGGQLLEKATHDFDVLLYLTGAMPARVAALCKRQVFGGDRPDDLHCPVCGEKASCPHSTTRKKNAASNDTSTRKDFCVFAREIDIFDIENCLVELDSGVTGTYSECFFSLAPFSRRYEINGTEGYLAIDFSKGQVAISNRTGDETFDFDYEGRIHYNGAPGVARHFLELMKGTTDLVHSPLDAAYAAELIAFAAYRSNAEGAFVNVDDIAAE